MASKLTASHFIKTNFYILLGEEQWPKINEIQKISRKRITR